MLDRDDPAFNVGVAKSLFDDKIASIPATRYCVAQLEQAPTTGRLHLQGMWVDAKSVFSVDFTYRLL